MGWGGIGCGGVEWGGVVGWLGGVVAHEFLVSAQGPLVLGLWVFGFWG